MKFERFCNIASWILLVLGIIWICLIAIPQFVDRVSRHEDEWARGQAGYIQEIPSAKPSDGD